MKKTLLIVALLLAGCGGDVSSNDNKNNIKDKTFSLEKVNNLVQGDLYSTTLLDAESKQYGTFSIQNWQEEVVNGVVVTPQYRRFTYDHVRYGSSTISAPTRETTSYFDGATKNLISFKLLVTRSGMGPRLNCVSSSPYHFPSTIKLGDGDALPSFACDNNINLGIGSWSTADGGDGHLNFIVRTQTIDESSQVYEETAIYTIGEQGNIVAFQIGKYKSIKD